MPYRLPLVSFALIAIVCGCSKHDPVADDVKPVNLALPVNQMTPDPSGGPPEGTSGAAAATPAPAADVAIPQPLHGRWGLTPGACSSPHARDLLVVTADALQFYESRAVPASGVQTTKDSINGTFHFTGEGQAWDKFEALQRNGYKLTRTETNPAASYTYAKC